MTLGEAKGAIRGGRQWADVDPLVPEADREELRRWFVHDHRPAPARAPATVAGSDRGQVCDTCGGMNFIQAGACLTCSDCGTSGGCS